MHFVHAIPLKILLDKLSTRSDNEKFLNLKLSINVSLCIIVLLSSHFFLIGIEKVIYFYMLSPIQSGLSLNSSAN